MNRSSNLVLPVLLTLVLLPAFAQATDFDVAMVNFAFDPEILTVQEGDTVTWTNTTTLPHTSTSGVTCVSDGLWNSGILSFGETYSVTFDVVGDFPYYCIPHCGIGMDGTIVVAPAGPAFTLDLSATYDLGTLSLDYTLGTPEPATWGNYLILTVPAIQVLPLWTVALPAIDPPFAIPISFPFPSVGLIGIYSLLATGEGVQIFELAIVDTSL